MRLLETDFRASNGFHKKEKAVNKRIRFPIDRSSDSTRQNEGFAKEIRFHHAEKLLLSAEISEKKLVKDGFK